jgi:hypothetical protein
MNKSLANLRERKTKEKKTQINMITKYIWIKILRYQEVDA